jgi:hypothetical protein
MSSKTKIYLKGLILMAVGILSLLLAKYMQDYLGIPLELNWHTIPMTISGLSVFIVSGIKFKFELNEE